MSAERPSASELGAALRALGEATAATRRSLEEGSLDELPALTAQRDALVRDLSRMRPDGAPWPAELQALVREIRDEGRRTQVLLVSLRDELESMIRSGREKRRAAACYGSLRTGS